MSMIQNKRDELIFYLDAANKFPIISKNNQE